MSDRRYAFLHRKLNFLQKKNELRSIIEDIREARAGQRDEGLASNGMASFDEDSYPDGTGIVERQREEDQDLEDALHVALKKGLITTNQIQKHVKLRNQLFSRNVKT